MSTILFILIGIKLKMGIAYWVLVYFKSLFDMSMLLGKIGDDE